MSRFFVGQRVRIVGAMESKFLIGAEARVVALGVKAWAPSLGEYVGIETDAVNINGRRFAALPSQLEPILPEGHQPSEFETLHDLLHSLGVEVAA